jgi:hypothetical protein
MFWSAFKNLHFHFQLLPLPDQNIPLGDVLVVDTTINGFPFVAFLQILDLPIAAHHDCLRKQHVMFNICPFFVWQTIHLATISLNDILLSYVSYHTNNPFFLNEYNCDILLDYTLRPIKKHLIIDFDS